MISETIVRFAFFINSSNRYKKVKTFFADILVNPEYPYKKYLDSFMIFLILTSVGILVHGVRNPVPEWMDFYDIYIVSFIFFIEYIARIWVHNDLHKVIVSDYEKALFLQKKFSLWHSLKKIIIEKLHYMVTPAAIIDLLAILPAYRPLRVLRIFVLFRVFKLLRYTKNINQFVEVLNNKRFELLTLLFLLIFIVMTAGIAIYVFEETYNPHINTLFDAIYWALVTISTVGYGDISPVTHQGRVVSMLIIVSGLAMISFVTSVIVSAFSEKLTELKDNRVIEEINTKESFLILCGYGQLVKMFLRQKQESEYPYVILEKDPEKVKQALKDGYNAIEEDASRYDVLSKFNIKYSKITVLCLTQSDIENIYITLNAKSLSKDILVIVKAIDENMERKYRLAGADHVLKPAHVANVMFMTAITQPIMHNALEAILTGKSMAYIDEVKVYEGSSFEGKRIEDIPLKEKKLLLIALKREHNGEFIFNPSKDLVFEKNDVMVIMGLKISVDDFKEIHQRGLL